MSLVERFPQAIAALRLQPGRAIVAVSGGADSVVLLDLLAGARGEYGLELIVAHVDHGISPDPLPRAIIQRHAARLGLRCCVSELHLGADATETEAREARLSALESIAGAEGAAYIFLAHHADDQAETVLMRVLRGSGPAGLAAMASRRDRFVRPLLPFTRSELADYADQQGLERWSDPANRDPKHLRSWLRSDILPALTVRLPDVQGKLGEVARQARTDTRAWREALHQWPGLDWRRDDVDSVEWTVLSRLPTALAGSLFRAFIREAGLRTAGARVRTTLEVLATATSGTRVDLGRGWRAELSFGRVRLLPPEAEHALPPMPLQPAVGQLDWGRWRLVWSVEPAPAQQERAVGIAWFAPGALIVRPWKPGDKVMPMGGVGHRLAVRCFQDAKVPSSARAGWPIIEGGDAIVWIPGVCRSDQLLPVPGASSLRVEVSAIG